jgi:hypothetical protein
MLKRRKSVRKKYRPHIVSTKLPQLLFTLDQLVILRKALVPLEQMILTTKEPLPHLQFALATITQVQAKVTVMIQQGVWGTGVGFDANEILILQTAVWIFMATLELVETSPEREDIKKQCRMLNALLTPLSKRVRTHN